MQDPLSFFHPIIQKWFIEKVGEPTDIQRKSWPEIAVNKHVLISAPTGSGKTLTAFLWAINQFAAKTWEEGELRVLYISPLKALNNDIRRNLLKPLFEIKEYFEKEGMAFPSIHVLTRSGDTPYDERYKMLRNPPEILITTPESLNIILTSANTRRILSKVSTVISFNVYPNFV
ncbi:DEAD/DEAH box helicase [Candidatus Desantisbacteria bacterium]|nr:DEAD/DEAH box helicase [Candidatus Desantisbacteria bacterium]